MNPWRLFDDGHPKAFSYLKVAIIGAILSVGVTLANNERTDQRTKEIAREASRVANIKSAEVARLAAVRLRNANVAGCMRDNAQRRDQNDTSATLKKFLQAAKVARQRALETSKTPADKKLNRDAIHTYETLINHFHLAPLVNCEAKYPDPTQGPPGPTGP